MAAVTMTGQFYTRVRPHSLDSVDSVAFLRHLRALLPGDKLLIIWDGSPIHRFKAMREFLTTAAASDFVFERLPAYAPDLNPLDAGVWHLLKDVALGNVCCQNLAQLRQALIEAIVRLRRKPRLIQACFDGAKLGME